jgi:hypothetical protein
VDGMQHVFAGARRRAVGRCDAVRGGQQQRVGAYGLEQSWSPVMAARGRVQETSGFGQD